MVRNRRITAFAAVAVISLVSACAWQAPVQPESTAELPESFPAAYYRQAEAQGTRVFRVDPSASLIVIEVRRGGSLARLGHDHVVASHDMRGFVAPSVHRADLYVRLDQLVVDEPLLRAEAGLDTEPTLDEIAGTRRNMLNTLEADRYPFVLINVGGNSEGEGETGLRVMITLHGIVRVLEVPVQIETNASAITVDGRLALKQTDFGITPLSVLGGAIQVQDQLELRFHVSARAQ